MAGGLLGEALALALLLLAVYAALFALDPFERVDLFAIDVFQSYTPALEASNSELVVIDERSLQAVGPWPWSRAVHAKLLSRLDELGAEVVAFGILFSEARGGETAFADAMKRHGRTLLAMHTDGQYGVLSLPELERASAGAGLVTIGLDKDGIVRRLAPVQVFSESALVSPALPVTGSGTVLRQYEPLGQAAASLQRERQFLSPDPALVSEILPRLGASIAEGISVADLFALKVSTSRFQGKTVFVGVSSAGLGETLAVPDGEHIRTVPAIAIHRAAFEAITQKRLSRPVELWQSNAAALLFIGVAVAALVLLPASLSLLAIVGCACVFLLVSALLLGMTQIWLPPSTLTIVLCLAYPLWSWRSLTRTSLFLRQEISKLSLQPVLSSPGRLTADDSSRLIREICDFFQPLHYTVETGSAGNRTGSITPLVDTVLLGEEYDLVELSFDASRLGVDPGQRNGEATVRMKFEGERRDELPEMQQHLNGLLLKAAANVQTVGRHWRLSRRELQIRRVRGAISNLARLNSFARTIINEVSDGIVVVGPTGCIELLNRQAGKILGQQATIGQPASHWLPQSRQFGRIEWSDCLRSTILSGRPARLEITTAAHAYVISIAPFREGGESAAGAVISLADVFMFHEAQKDRLEAINFVSHDIRTPLSSQLATLDSIDALLLDCDTADTLQQTMSSLRTRLDEARHLAGRSLSMADEFIQLARLEAMSVLTRRDVCLEDLLDNAVDSVFSLAERKRVHLERPARLGEELWASCNPSLLERAVINLLSNAIKHSSPGQTVTLECWRNQSHLCLGVSDEGEGLDETELGSMFDAFKRTEHSERQGMEGSGLGLRMVQVIAQKHDGYVEVESSLGSGSTFTIYLSARANSAL